MYDYIVIGGGIVGLATAWQLKKQAKAANIAVLEKEADWALHQTGRNSGVLHSGVYYQPGSLKAKLAIKGRNSMIQFCQQYDVPYEVCGKVIVATNEQEFPAMEKLYQRGRKNGLTIMKLHQEQVKEHEPHVRSVGGLYIPSTGIVNYQEVANRLVELLRQKGVDFVLNTEVMRVHEQMEQVIIETNHQTYTAKNMINCAGLYSDELVKQSGIITDVKIIPFRGEYFTLKESKRYLVKNLIYPVPNPKYPFLGIHLTRMINGEVHAGPNAVVSLKKEGYQKRDIDIKEAFATLSFPGFWRLAKDNISVGMMEVSRSIYKGLFVRSLQRLVPDIQANDIVKADAGVRAQAMLKDGQLLDDFFMISGKRMTHVCNAPSPAATAALEIGKIIAKNKCLK
ncbi:L-2-hydroxyglutarate oxidase [Virgibacillus proomii]|uniref:L-2-hydroxyglutarate oxidase n=1 Tax=Virgibacillus proomii TaxID=84407 RepID=UPI000987B4CB|nr:L-2-hydroxyglutarate oxidase [Virgibacillus proomii]